MKNENITNILSHLPSNTMSDSHLKYKIKEMITIHSISFVLTMVLGALFILSANTLIGIGLSIQFIAISLYLWMLHSYIPKLLKTHEKKDEKDYAYMYYI